TIRPGNMKYASGESERLGQKIAWPTAIVMNTKTAPTMISRRRHDLTRSRRWVRLASALTANISAMPGALPTHINSQKAASGEYGASASDTACAAAHATRPAHENNRCSRNPRGDTS